MKKGINDKAFIKEVFAGRVRALIWRSITGNNTYPPFNVPTLGKVKLREKRHKRSF